MRWGLSQPRPGRRPGVVKLGEQLTAMALDTPGQMAQTGNKPIIPQAQIDPRGFLNGAAAQNDGRRPASGDIFVQIGSPALFGRAIRVPQPGRLTAFY